MLIFGIFLPFKDLFKVHIVIIHLWIYFTLSQILDNGLQFYSLPHSLSSVTLMLSTKTKNFQVKLWDVFHSSFFKEP